MVITCIRIGEKYGVEYVTALENGLRQHSLRAIGVECIRSSDYEGWWSKLELFAPGKDIKRIVYYLDLDLVILPGVDAVFDALDKVDAPIAGIRDYQSDSLNSSVMRIDRYAQAARAVWEDWTKHGRLGAHGDQDVIWRAAKDEIGFIPDALCQSYKVAIGKFHQGAHRAEAPLTACRILVFHGRPKPHEVASNLAAPLHELVVKNWTP